MDHCQCLTTGIMSSCPSCIDNLHEVGGDSVVQNDYESFAIQLYSSVNTTPSTNIQVVLYNSNRKSDRSLELNKFITSRGLTELPFPNTGGKLIPHSKRRIAITWIHLLRLSTEEILNQNSE